MQQAVIHCVLTPANNGQHEIFPMLSLSTTQLQPGGFNVVADKSRIPAPVAPLSQCINISLHFDDLFQVLMMPAN